MHHLTLDVNDADRTHSLEALFSQDQEPNMYDLDRLDYGQTYYWRIDEVNGDGTTPGTTWHFTTQSPPDPPPPPARAGR